MQSNISCEIDLKGTPAAMVAGKLKDTLKLLEESAQSLGVKTLNIHIKR